ncbi:hypothetical protein D3C86_1868680 [compost metagenome]
MVFRQRNPRIPVITGIIQVDIPDVYFIICSQIGQTTDRSKGFIARFSQDGDSPCALAGRVAFIKTKANQCIFIIKSNWPGIQQLELVN